MRGVTKITRLVLMATATLASICWADGLDTPLRGDASVHPLWLPDEPHPFDKRLVGKWSSYYVFSWGLGMVPLPVRLQVTGDRKTGAYELKFRSLEKKPDDSEVPPITLRGFLVKLEGQLFLDVTAADKTPGLHRIFLVIFDKGIPRLVRWQLPLQFDAAAEQVGLDGNDVATADTQRLRQFLAEHAQDKRVFPTAGQECNDGSCLDWWGVFPLLPPGVVPKLTITPAPDRK